MLKIVIHVLTEEIPLSITSKCDHCGVALDQAGMYYTKSTDQFDRLTVPYMEYKKCCKNSYKTKESSNAPITEEESRLPPVT